MHFTIVAALFFCATAAAQPTVCPEHWTYVEKAQRCYWVVPGRWNSFSWNDAQKICQEWNATLPSAFDQQTDDALRGFASGRIVNNPGIFHLGLRHTYKPTAPEGEWFWPDGCKATYTSWQGGRAELDRGHCAQGGLHEAENGYWRAIDCNLWKWPVICELPPATGDKDATAAGNSSGANNARSANRKPSASRPKKGGNGSVPAVNGSSH